MRPITLAQPVASDCAVQDVQDVQNIQKKLDALHRYQQQAARSLLAFSKRIRAKPDHDRDNAIKRLKFHSPPGWCLTTRVQQRQVAVFGMTFEEKRRRLEEKIQQLDQINSLEVNNDEKLSHFLDRQVITPFKSQYWLKASETAGESMALELCGCSWHDGQVILDQLEVIMGQPIFRLGAKSATEGNASGCGKQVWDLLKQTKADGLFCRVIAIDGCDPGVLAADLLQEIKEQFKDGGHKAIVIVFSKKDGGRSDLEQNDKIERYWFHRLQESKSITKSLQLQTEMVTGLNDMATRKSNKDTEIASAVTAHKAPNGWRIITGQLDGCTQITSMRFDVMNEALDTINPLLIPVNTELQKFMNENVVTPFKNQQAYQACGLLDNVMASILCGSTVAKRAELLKDLQSTLQHTLYLLPPQEADAETAKGTDPVKGWLANVLSEVKFVSLDCIVVAIEADLLKPEIKLPALFSSVERAVMGAGLRAIVLIMSSSDTTLDELSPDIKRFDFDPEAQASTRQRVRWYLLNEIKKCCSDHDKNVENIDWTNAIKALIKDIISDPESSRALTKSEIKKVCVKKAEEFFANLMCYCASHGQSQISQDAVKESLKKPADKQFKKLERRVEDFVLPGQASLTAFFRSHVIKHLCNPEIFARYGLNFPGSFLLAGPPGTGKTHALKQLAEFTELAFFEMSPSTVGSCYVDECERNMADMFSDAEKKKGAIIMMDEIDSMLPSRQHGLAHFNIKRTNELLGHIEAAQKKRILVVGTTNRLDALDLAALRQGRIGKIVTVEGLTRDGARELLKATLEDFCQPETSLDFTAAVNALGENRLVADVYGFCSDLKMFAARQEVYPLTQKILDQYLLSDTQEHRHVPEATLNARSSGGCDPTFHLDPGERRPADFK